MALFIRLYKSVVSFTFVDGNLHVRVRTGHGILQFNSFSRPGKSWNLSGGHGNSWKMTEMIFLRTTNKKYLE